MRSSGRTTLTTALTWTPALTISHQHALRFVAGPGAQGRPFGPFKLVKSTQTGKIAAETASNTVTTENIPELRVALARLGYPDVTLWHAMIYYRIPLPPKSVTLCMLNLDRLLILVNHRFSPRQTQCSQFYITIRHCKAKDGKHNDSISSVYRKCVNHHTAELA